MLRLWDLTLCAKFRSAMWYGVQLFEMTLSVLRWRDLCVKLRHSFARTTWLCVSLRDFLIGQKKPTETPWKRLENPTEFCNLSPKRHFVSTSRKHKSKSTKAFSVSTVTVCFTGLSVCYHASFGSCAIILFAFLGFFFRRVGSRQSADCTWSE